MRVRVGLLVFFLLIGLPVIAREADDAAAAKETSRSMGETLCPNFVQDLEFCTEEELQGLKECQWGEDPVSKQCGLGKGQIEVTLPAGFAVEMRCGKKKDKIVRCKSSVAQTLRLDAETCRPISFEICCNEVIDICRIPTEEHYPPSTSVEELKCGDRKVDRDPGVTTERGETCDPPGSYPVPHNICRSDCTYCGDERLDEGEECDEGYGKDDDDCSDGCRKKRIPIVVFEEPPPREEPPLESGGLIGEVALFGGGDTDVTTAWGESLRCNPQPPVDPSILLNISGIRALALRGGYRWFRWSVAVGPVFVEKPDADGWWLDRPDFTPFDETIAVRVKGGRKGFSLHLTSPTPFGVEDLHFSYSIMVIEDQDVIAYWREGASRPSLELHRDELWSVGFGPGYQVTEHVMVYGELMYTFTDYAVEFNGPPDPDFLETTGLGFTGADDQLLLQVGVQF